jgi:hypothetical protein
MHNSCNITDIVTKNPDLERIFDLDSDDTAYTQVEVFGGGEILTFRCWVFDNMGEMLLLWQPITFQG